MGRRAGARRRGRHPVEPARRPLGDPSLRDLGGPCRRRGQHRLGARLPEANAPFTTGGVYLNFIGDEGDERIKAAFGAEKYERLAQIKAEYDPGNVFAGNQNIRPKVSA